MDGAEDDVSQKTQVVRAAATPNACSRTCDEFLPPPIMPTSDGSFNERKFLFVDARAMVRRSPRSQYGST